MRETKNIISIISADGWYSTYKQEDGSLHKHKLVCWALVKDEEDWCDVEGMDSAGDYIDFCVSAQNFSGYILEPSAGTGSFFKQLPVNKRIGVDIQPKFDGIIEMDYFDFVPQFGKSYLVIGNPPFGRISSIAVKFFNKSATFADCIAFIIPRTFKRVSIQNKLNLNFKLIYNEDT